MENIVTINGEEWLVKESPSGGISKEIVKTTPEEQEVEPTSKFSSLAFMGLVGDANMVTLLTLAKTNPIIELMIKKIDRAKVIDFDDEVHGPKAGLAYVRSLGDDVLTEEEYQRILNREY